MSRPAVREATIHGHTLCYRIAGTGPVLMLVHGIAGSADTWDEIIPALARTHTVIAPDLPGHGASSKPPGDYSIGALANTLRDLLVYLGHDKATVVGHSLGGGVAMQYAYQFPERCERLVLVSSGGLGRDVVFILRAAALPGADLFINVTARVACLAGIPLKRVVGDRVGPDVREVARGYASLADAETRAAFLSTLRAVIGTDGQRVDASNRLYMASEMPTLIIWGARDPIIPVEHGRRAHEAMPGSRLRIFEEAGHLPYVDHPEEFVSALLAFIDENPPAHFTAADWADLLRRGTAAA